MADAPDTKTATPSGALPWGVNVLGFITANFGQGFAIRNTIRALEGSGTPWCGIDLDPGLGRKGKNSEIPAERLGQNVPFLVNLLHANPPEARAELLVRGDTLHLEEHVNVGIMYWELPLVPPSWIPQIRTMDAMLAPTRFILDALQASVPDVPAIHYPQAALLPAGIQADRARFGFTEDEVVFLVSFDMHSDIERKNPWAAIDAFVRTFGPAPERARLAVKLASVGAGAALEELGSKLQRRAAESSGIVLLERDLNYEEVLSLYASADVVVSLHRSEGLGLVPMEAMSLGKPVIATGWSGNMDFMTSENSCLVGYDLVPVQASSQAAYSTANIGPGQVWAEPSVDDAARWMRQLVDDTTLRELIGARAAAAMAARRERFLRAEVFGELASLREAKRSPEAIARREAAWRAMHAEPPAPVGSRVRRLGGQVLRKLGLRR